jgi:hypothetical protein
VSARHRQPARPAPTPPEDTVPPVPAVPAVPTRRERRAAARGGASVKVAGAPVGRRVPPPARHRDYASRRRG